MRVDRARFVQTMGCIRQLLLLCPEDTDRSVRQHRTRMRLVLLSGSASASQGIACNSRRRGDTAAAARAGKAQWPVALVRSLASFLSSHGHRPRCSGSGAVPGCRTPPLPETCMPIPLIPRSTRLRGRIPRNAPPLPRRFPAPTPQDRFTTAAQLPSHHACLNTLTPQGWFAAAVSPGLVCERSMAPSL